MCIRDRKAKQIAKKVKLRGVPSAVAVNDSGIVDVFVGAYEVAELGNFLKARGYNATTNFTVGGLNYTVRDCIECHVKGSGSPVTLFVQFLLPPAVISWTSENCQPS